MNIKHFLCLIAMFGAANCASSPRPDEVGPTSICDIVENPSGFAGRSVVVRGQIISDYIERAGIQDRRCPGRILPFGAAYPRPIGNTEFEEKLASVRGVSDAEVELIAEGTVQFHPNEFPRLALIIREFSDIAVVQRQ